KVGAKLSELELCVLRQLFKLPHLTELLKQYPILFLVDDTLQPKFGKKFEHVKVLHDHARHLGKEFVNAHDFVTLAVAFPMRAPAEPRSVQYLMVPFACRMYQPEGDSKLKMAANLAEQALKIVGQQQHIIFECDSWYPKKDVLNFVKDHDNVDFIANIRKDTALYQLPQRTGKRGRPRKYGQKFQTTDIVLTGQDKHYAVGMTKCMTKLFDQAVWIIRSQNCHEGERLFISTLPAQDLPELTPHKTGFWRILDYYNQRWKIETYFYEIKKFWSFGSYQVRSQDKIEGLHFIANLAYLLTQLLPQVRPEWQELRGQGISARKNALSRAITKERIFTSLAQAAQKHQNSEIILQFILDVGSKTRKNS
ncbi:IS701 family transposase, partial [Ligilactobacillus pobuzihii]